MKKIILLGLTCAIATVAKATSSVEFCNLGKEISTLQATVDAQNDVIKAYLKNKQVVYISGFLGCAQDEFDDNRAFIHSADATVPVTTICPDTVVAVESNVAFILGKLKKITEKSSQRQVILIGQSKGGAEALQTAAQNPALFSADAIKQYGFQLANVITFSAAIGGSVLPDLMLKSNPEFTEKWEIFKKKNGIQESAIGSILADIFLHTGSPGFKSISTQASSDRNQKLLAMTDPMARKTLNEKIFFVTAERDPESRDMPFLMKDLARFMSEQAEPNDGLVFTHDQFLQGLGTKLIELTNAGHFSLIGPYDETYCRQEFMRYLLLKVAGRSSN